jgi:DNA-directed RNA polymerase II subunit RPB1
MTCDADDPKEEGADPDAEEPKKGHGGCGHQQPVIRKEGLKMFVQYKRSKDDDDVGVNLVTSYWSVTLLCSPIYRK